MKRSGRKNDLSFSPFRRRQQAAKDRRFCIRWINRMVNKQVEKQIPELSSELLFLHLALREEMVAELQELRELLEKAATERSLNDTGLEREQRVTSRWQSRSEKEYKEKSEEDEKDNADRETLSFDVCETPCDSDSTFMRKPSYELGESMRILLDVPSDSDTCDVTNDADTSSQPATFEQEEIQNVATVADTSQLKKGSEEKEISRNPFHANPSFITEELRCEEERVGVDETKEEEALLKERQWKEWMDKQEMRGHHNKAKPVDKQNTETPGGAAPPVSQKQVKQNPKEVNTVRKIKTYFCDLLNPHTSYKWERFEDEE